ncbi:DUF4905 domain-containing protein [Pontibacter sp. CAU 1760]
MWRICLDTSARRLALEVRDGDLLLAHFYTYAAETRNLRQLTLPQKQAWWLGLEDAQDGNVYLHGYGDRKLGQHKGVYALEASTDTLVWQQEEQAFYGITAEGIITYDVAAPEADFRVLEPGSGAVLPAGVSQQQAARQMATYSAHRYSQTVYPTLYLEGEAYFNQVQRFLETLGIRDTTQAIEYAETETHIVIGCYVREPGAKLKQTLLVLDLNGAICLKEPMAHSLTGVGSDSFFIFMNDLYYIQDKRILQVYQLLAS